MAAKFYFIAFIVLFALIAESSAIGTPVPSNPSSGPEASGRISSFGYGPSININPVNNAKSESNAQPDTEQDASHTDY